ncbi:MAG: secretin N-terminal domain-containing protein [Terricaulis sp.]
MTADVQSSPAPASQHETLMQRMREELARQNGQTVDELQAATGNVATQTAASAPAAATPEQIASVVPDQQVRVTLVPQAVPQFIDTAFGQILHVPYYTGPGVAQRRDFVTLRAPETMNGRDFFKMVQATLSQYGLAVLIDGGAVRIIQDDVLSGQAPNFIRTRSMPDTPASSRPVVQFFQLSALDVDAVMPLLDTVYPNRGSVRITPQPETNTLMLVGSSRDVAAIGTLLDQIDRPRFADAHVASVHPVYMSSEQLADAVTRSLSAEGYQVSGLVENRPRAISLVPIAQANQMLVFTSDTALFNRALYWAHQLDTPEAIGDGQGVFIYTAVNATAEDLGALVAQVSGGANGGASNSSNPPEVAVRRTNGVRTGGDRPDTQGPGATTSGAFTIDPAGNRILFHGTAAEYAHVHDLLQQLDTPPKQVLIEVTVAEVTLTDATRFGVEWFIDSATNNGTLSGGTVHSAPQLDNGLFATASHVYSRGTVTAALTALASNDNLNILSTPRLVTRSGNEAQILIGNDIPIITSQRAADQQTGGNTDVLQTVQYRQTGVILNVRPVVYGDDRVDIQLYQEVSNQAESTNDAIASPSISNRSVTTQLALQEGQTAVIGGMIQDNYRRVQSGVPGLKDIPLLGAAFRTDRVAGTKTELVLLVTPYIVHDSGDMAQLAEGSSRVVNRDMNARGPQVYTLYPWHTPFAQNHDHELVPHVRPARGHHRNRRPAPAAAHRPATAHASSDAPASNEAAPNP